MIRQEQCDKVCRILDNYLANRPTERDSLIVAVQKAFDVLEQPETNCSEIPNNSDTISRQQAIDALKEKVFHNLSDEFYGAMQVLDELPSVQPEQRWIPCSERLPEEGEVVLTQAKFKDDVKMAVSSRIDYNYWTTWGTRDINIIAWMPLPEPARLEND